MWISKISLQDLRPVCRKDVDVVNSIFQCVHFKFAINACKFKVKSRYPIEIYVDCKKKPQNPKTILNYPLYEKIINWETNLRDIAINMRFNWSNTGMKSCLKLGIVDKINIINPFVFLTQSWKMNQFGRSNLEFYFLKPILQCSSYFRLK